MTELSITERLNFAQNLADCFESDILRGLFYELDIDLGNLESTAHSKLAHELVQRANLETLSSYADELLKGKHKRPALGLQGWCGTQAGCRLIAEPFYDAVGAVGELSAEDEADLRALRRMVERFWITGYLQDQLHQQVQIELGKEWATDQVQNPWATVLELPQKAKQVLPAERTIAEVFEEVERFLLILGEPGSGKTITLLQLTQALLAQDKSRVPVVFNLSSWAKQSQLSLAEWLTQEFKDKYKVSPKLADCWLRARRIVPLLDGLDEVAEEKRAACVVAINAFVESADYGVSGLAVCCRVHEYGLLHQADKRLKLRGAVRLQPLTVQQVEVYLAQAGDALAGLRETLAVDEELQTLALSPLMLNVMTLAYLGEQASAMAAVSSVEERRAQVFELYIEKMFKRRDESVLYQKERVLTGLTWLAQQLKTRDQTVFLVEDLQLDWLGSLGQRWTARLVSGLVSGLVFGLVFGLVSGLLIGLLIGLAEIKPEEELTWSWSQFQASWWQSIKTGLIVGLVIGLVIGLIVGLVYGLVIGLIVGLVIGLVVGLVVELTEAGMKKGKINDKTKPNQGIHAALHNGLFGAGLLCIFTPIFWLAATSLTQSNLTLLQTIVATTFAGYLFYGGLTALKHYSLRLALTLFRYTPLNYPKFLNYAAHLFLLRRIGGGYLFLHRLLLEHFAARNNNKP